MTVIRVANGVVVGGLALILTLDASVQEFTELISLSLGVDVQRSLLVSTTRATTINDFAKLGTALGGNANDR